MDSLLAHIMKEIWIWLNRRIKIKRPLLGVLIMVLLGEWISIMAGIPLLMMIIIGLSSFILWMIHIKKVWKWYIIFPFFVLIAFFRMEWASVESGIDSDIQYHIEGKVNKVVEKEGSRQIYLYNAAAVPADAKTVVSAAKKDMDCAVSDVKPVRIKGIIINDTSPSQEILAGDKISCDVELKYYEEARNPGNFNSKLYYETMNIECCAWTDQITVTEKNGNPWVRGIFYFKRRLLESYQKIGTKKDAGIYSSIVLGDKSMLDTGIKQIYQINGMAHILAISGLHVSILGMGFYRLLRKCCIPFLPCFLVSFLLIVSYGIMTGSSISTIRAIIMFLMGTFADVLGRTYDIISSLSFSAVILILIYPKIIYNSGFWLSFLAVAGIVAVKPALDYLMGTDGGKKKRFVMLRSAFTASLSVNIATLPVLLISYYEIPLYSVFLNMLVLPLMTFLMPGAVGGGIIGMVSVPAGAFCAGMAHYILFFYEWICKIFIKLPFSVLIIGKPSSGAVFFYYLFIAAMVVLVKKSRKTGIFAVCMAVFILILRPQPDFMIRMLDVGQGDGIHVSSSGINMLVDGGSTSVKKVGEYRIIPYLKSQAVRQIDYMVMTHADADHVNGLLEIMENDQINIRYLIMPGIGIKTESYEKLEQKALQNGITIRYINAGMEFECGDINVKCLHPVKDYSYASENDYSTVLLLSYEDVDLLLTGDIEDKGENSMMDACDLPDIDILKTAHHGSRYSTDEDFLQITRPEIALISCGKDNSYGHPHEELLERLEKAGVKIYVTAWTGAVTITGSSSGIQVDTFLNP